jgi:hypothetical protein
VDVLFLELLLWGGLLFFFWALKDGLGRVESDMENSGVVNVHGNRNRKTGLCFDQPESVAERIGSYKDAAIYRYAVFNGRRYEFERACPEEARATIAEYERYVAPGLVYAPRRQADISLARQDNRFR